MIVSLNEIEQTVLKAVRGAGRPWGEAEEIAAAARWIALHLADVQNWNWLASLVSALGSNSDARSAVHRSAAISDLEAVTHGLRIADVQDPMWLAAFAAAHAIGSGRAIALVWDGANLIVDVTGTLSVAQGNIAPDHAVTVTITASDAAPRASTLVSPRSGGRAVDAALWQQLHRLESKTSVPASDHSRQSGAGATISDND
jgi:Protein of unknown function (DUF3726)